MGQQKHEPPETPRRRRVRRGRHSAYAGRYRRTADRGTVLGEDTESQAPWQSQYPSPMLTVWLLAAVAGAIVIAVAVLVMGWR